MNTPAQVSGPPENRAVLGAADATSPCRLVGRVVGGPQELWHLVDHGDDLALVPDVVARGHAVDAHGEELVADLPRHPEAAGGVLHVRDAVADVVQGEEGGQGLLHDAAPGAAHHVADDEDLQSRPTPSASATRLM